MPTTDGSDPRFDPMDAAVHDDPYPVYARLRASGNGIHRGREFVVVSRYLDVAALLRDRRFGQDVPPRPASETSSEPLLIDLDPPAHTTVRRTAARLIERSRLEQLRPRVAAAATQLVQPLLDGVEVELLTEIAQPLAWVVLSELLAIPEEERSDVLVQVRVITDALEQTKGADPASVVAADKRLTSYLADLAPWFFADRGDPGPGTSVHRQVGLLRLLVVAGQDTTASMIGNAAHMLLSNPAAEQRWRTGEACRTAVDELIRFDGPVQFVARRALTDAMLSGTDLPAGTRVLALIGSANRDPAEFVEPDGLRLDRINAARQLGFGHGPHFCLGADLARLTVGCALDALFGQCPALEVTAPIVRSPRVTLRSLAALPVKRRAAST